MIEKNNHGPPPYADVMYSQQPPINPHYIRDSQQPVNQHFQPQANLYPQLPPPINQHFQPPPVNQHFQPPPSNQHLRPPPVNQDYSYERQPPPTSNQDYSYESQPSPNTNLQYSYESQPPYKPVTVIINGPSAPPQTNNNNDNNKGTRHTFVATFLISFFFNLFGLLFNFCCFRETKASTYGSIGGLSFSCMALCCYWAYCYMNIPLYCIIFSILAIFCASHGIYYIHRFAKDIRQKTCETDSTNK